MIIAVAAALAVFLPWFIDWASADICREIACR